MQFNRILSDPKQKSILEILNLIRFSDFRPFCKDYGQSLLQNRVKKA